MIFSQDRNALRRFMMNAWTKFAKREPLEPIEKIIGETIQRHPEYHALFDDSEKNLHRDFHVEHGATNPFLHISLHVAITEQLMIDRPVGIRSVYQALIANLSGDSHAAEHKMIDCLAEAMYVSQRTGTPPDEASYLESLKRIAGGKIG